MLSLAYLLHVEAVAHSYGAAGLVLAASSIGQAISGPLTSRWMGVWGMRPVLILTSVVALLSMGTIAFVLMPVWLYMVVGFVGGLAVPPVQPAVRTIYPKMVTSAQLTPLFSLDASAQELIWVAGPVITTFVATQIGTVAAICVAMAFLLVGGVWFIASPEVGRVRSPRSSDAMSPDTNGKIRYTVANEFLIVRGQSMRLPPQGAQMWSLAEYIVKSPHYLKEGFSWGDSMSKKCSEQKVRGSSTNWIAYDTSHHLAAIVAEIYEYVRTTAGVSALNQS